MDAVLVPVALWGPVLYIAVALWLWFAPSRDRRRRRHVVLLAMVGLLVALGLSGAMGVLWYRPRPFVVQPADHLLIHHAADTSFPSDHEAVSMAIAAALAVVGASWAWPLYLWAAVVGGARVFVGVLWPTDVIFGALLGWVAARAVVTLRPGLEPLMDRVLDLLGPLGRDAAAAGGGSAAGPPRAERPLRTRGRGEG